MDWKLGDKVKNKHGRTGVLIDIYPLIIGAAWFIEWKNGEVEEFLVSDANRLERIK